MTVLIKKRIELSTELSLCIGFPFVVAALCE